MTEFPESMLGLGEEGEGLGAPPAAAPAWPADVDEATAAWRDQMGAAPPPPAAAAAAWPADVDEATADWAQSRPGEGLGAPPAPALPAEWPQLENPWAPPEVVDPDLRKIVNTNYRSQSTMGDGSTAYALLQEARTGRAVGDKWHDKKAYGEINRINTWLENHPNANPNDIQSAEAMRYDLQNALDEWDSSSGSWGLGAKDLFDRYQ